MVDMNSKLDTWKNKLLDMSKRNRLLNYRETKRGTLRFERPDIYELWQSFVLDENPLEFPIVDENNDKTTFSEEETENYEQAEIEGFSDEEDEDEIITNKTPADRQKTLRNLRNKSRSVMEEQGVNALYLSFGFLKWSEIGYSKETYDAPLVLVPVTIKWESILSPFVMELHEDEIVLNPTLIYKLENDFGCTLPEFNIDTPLEDYLDQIEELVSANHWEVIREASLGMLSFLRINMYRDLEEHKDDIIKNPIIRAISGDASSIPHDLSGIEDYDFDKNEKADQLFQVVDADSSQQEAILCAKRGVSFVLQGPPGTGKSQTITNIIAESLGAGKKVLFVSEKMAALDVVYKRLEEANLADFCLVLHSHKANKKQTLAQLGEVLQLASKKASVNEEAYEKLSELSEDKEKLNQYDHELHTVVEPLNKSIYDANGMLASLQDFDEVIFTVPNVRKTSEEQYRSYVGNLQKYANFIATQKFNYQDNPWRDSNVSFISNELRHDINARGKSLADYMKQLTVQFDETCNALHFQIDDSFTGAKILLEVLNEVKERKPFLSRWFTQDDILALRNETAQCEELQVRFVNKRDDLFSLVGKIPEYDENFTYEKQSPFSTSELIKDQLTIIEDFLNNDQCYKAWEDASVYDRLESSFEETKQIVGAYNETYNEISNSFEHEIFDIPYNDIYLRYKVNCTSAFKAFNSQYRKDRKLIRSLNLNSNSKMSDDEILDVLLKLRKLQEDKSSLDQKKGELNSLFPGYYQGEATDFESIREHITAFQLLQQTKSVMEELEQIVRENENHDFIHKEHFEQMYNGLGTDWDNIRQSLFWTEKLKKILGEYAAQNESFIVSLATNENYCLECEKYAEQLESSISDASEDFNWFSQLFEDPAQFKSMRLIAVADRCEECYNNLAALEEWIDFKSVRQACLDLDLGEYISIVESNNIQPKDIAPVFEKRFFTLWLDSVLPEYPSVAGFRRRTQDERVKEFQELDKSQFVIAQSRIRQKLISSLPSLDRFTNGADEISILRHELGKQRRIMPIRKLFNRIPNLILKLKPCLMMSPLTVSLYLESESFEFDTVIFDEASQVTTENAIGAILRGKQVVIAGDSKQLPPTNFFSATVGGEDFDTDEDSDEYEDEDSYESILEEANCLPERTLLWHYRSKHEHLIAFSNAEIYHNNLITFPSSIDKAPDRGVEFVYVPDGFYDRGGRKGNPIEAEKVAQMVFEHFKKHPDRSLGVIAFGEVQQLAIDTALRNLRQEDSSYEQFFDEDREEPFFIKSLENVQGDERDTIIFSVGYAKDANGVMRMNFGPLGKAGGERRLNVAVTRAKFNVKLVSSILATDIDLSHVSNEGPKLLRSYIEYAQKGPSVLESKIDENAEIQFDSPFEESVYNFLDRKEYKIATQVGCSGYRIDLAIKHPTLSGRYVLGIECDGATYHSARTARERDRLRQDVLENMGWKLYRIWSTDWIKDPVNEGEKLIEAIESAITNYVENDESIVEPYGEKDPVLDSNDYLTEEDVSISDIDMSNPYHFQELPTVNWIGLPRDVYGKLELTDCIGRIIDTLYPVHFDEICQIIAPLLGREKATSVVKRNVEYGLKLIKDKYVNIDQFYFPIECNPKNIFNIPCRVAGKRSIKHISSEEIARGMLNVAEASVGITEEGLIAETVRAFGFNRSGPNIMTAMHDAFDMLLNNNWIEIVDDKIKLLGH